MAERGITLVFGGGRVGLMGIIADAVLAAGGRVVGIIPNHIEEREVGHPGVSELQVVDSMHERKHRMFQMADGFVVLPGGLGTLDETFEIITWRQLGLHDKPIVIVDNEGYWRPLAALIAHLVDNGFARPEVFDLFTVVPRVDEVFAAVARARAPKVAPRGELI